MDTIVQTLNTAGWAFVQFALPMLLQSSLLILLLLGIDALLRRRVRAVFRYWIWMLVLIKLVLPPSLWSPVSLGTWVGDELEVSTAALLEPAPALPGAPSPAARPSPVASILSSPDPLFTADPGPRMAERTPSSAPIAAPEPVVARPAGPTLTWQGFVVLLWGMTVVALLLLLWQRAYFVQGLVAQAAPADRRMLDVLEECRAHLGLRRPVALRLSPNATSPAVCGLLRTTILIPQNLAPRLQGRDLRAVFLHELAHIRRGDLWVNFAQTLLQIAYFYHPLLWLANAVMRRAREQAVDETVLVAMGETGAQYPETLINIAKLAFRRRPVLSLRLVGVVESRSALSARIKHMLSRPLPRTAKLGLLGLFVLVVTAAVLLPMAGMLEPHATVVNDGPLDIRFLGVCPDQSGELLDGDGRKIDTTICPCPGQSVWKADSLRRDFMFELPEANEPILFSSRRLVSVAGEDTQLHQSNANLLFPAVTEGRSIVAVDTCIPQVYRRSVLRFFSRQTAVDRVDVALKYFYGPPRETVLNFQGPFVQGQVLAATEAPGAKLTVLPERDDGPQGERRACFSLDLPYRMDLGTPVLLYDTEGRRHMTLASTSIYRKNMTLEFYDSQEYTPLSKVARVAVEKPYAFTARNVRVSYPDRPPRDHAPYLDVMAQRLGWTGTPEELARHQILSFQEAIQVIDVVEGAGQVRNALEPLRFNRSRRTVADLDPATQEKLHQTAARWAACGWTSHYGIQLGLIGRWPEFFNMALARFTAKHPTATASPYYEKVVLDADREIANVLANSTRDLTPEQVQQLRQAILTIDDGWVSYSLLYCLSLTPSPATADLLWELAHDDRPWIWWPALDLWRSHSQAPARQVPQGLPEPMDLRLALVLGKLDNGDLKARAAVLLRQIFTSELSRKNSMIWDRARERIVRDLDKVTATALCIEYLRQARSAIASRLWQIDDALQHQSGSTVAYIIRTLNVWYGHDFGGLGTDETGDSIKRLAVITSTNKLDPLIAEVLAWYDAERMPNPVELPLKGVVVDTAGKPVAGAKLRLTRREDYTDERGYRNQRSVDAGHVQTDADGSFVCENLANAESHELTIEAEGFAKREGIGVMCLPDGRFRISGDTGNTVVMEKPASLSGRVIGPDGQPLANAVVQLACYPMGRTFRPVLPRTDREGCFAAGSLISGSYLVVYREAGQPARKGDFETVKAFQLVPLEEGQTVADVVLDVRDSTCSLEFEIVDGNGQPIAASSVVLEVPLPSSHRSFAGIAGGFEIPAQRIYRLSQLPPMEGFLSVYPQGQPPRRVPVKLVANETTRCKVVLEGSGDREENLAAEMARRYEKYTVSDRPAPVEATEGTATADSDGDGLSDSQEVYKYLTDPKKKDSDDDGTPDGDWNERREYAYSVRTVLRYLPPFDEKGLNDDLQDARVLKQSAEYVEVEVIHYPLATGYDAIPENPNWRRDYAREARLAEYLAPGATTNWDEPMRKDLSAALKADGIDVETLTDKQVVERVSSWLLKRSRYLDSVFTTYYVDFPQRTPRVYPGLEDAFRHEFERDSRNYDWTIEKHFDHELLGKGMFYNKTHGSCTSTAIYLTTVLRALGIPTRMVLATPAVDASDRAQVLKVKNAITHHRVRLTMLAGLSRSSHGWTNHTFNEVYVGNRWCRLDYTQLGCPALGLGRFGLQTHLYTFNDLSDVNFAPTWGWRYAKGEHSDTFQHDNPYSAVEVSELFGPHGNIPNPPFTAQDLISHPQPDIFLFSPSRVAVWQEFIDLVGRETGNKTGRSHDKAYYDDLFDGTWLTRPQDILVLLFALDTPERVPAGYEDLLPRPWAEIESALQRGETVELGGKAREMNVILLAAPTGDGLKALVPNSKLLRALGGAGPAASVAPSRPAVLTPSLTEPAKLSGGVTVELLGVCEYPSTGKPWWRPDGSALNPAPYQTANNKRELKEGFRDYELVVRYSGAPEMDIQWDVPGSASTSVTGHPCDAAGEPLPDLTVCTVRFPQAQTATDVRVAAAAGTWETRATHTALEREGSYPLEGGKAVAFGIPYTKDGDTFVPVTTDLFAKDMAFRVVAMQGQNEAHSGGMSGFGDTLNSLTYRFKCPLREIRELRFQTRPWTWVEFRNVALRPGLKTGAQAEVLSGAQANRPGRRPPGEEKVFGLGPAWEVLKAAVGDHYGGTIGGFGSDATQRKQYFDEIFSLTHAGDVFVLMFAFDQPVGVPPEYMDLLPLPWAQIESRVRAGESFEAQGQARDLTVLVLAAPTSGQLHTLVRRAHPLDAFRSSPSPQAQPSQDQTTGQRRVVLPEVDQRPVILDLATGELVPLPPVGPEPAKLQEALRQLGKGDILYDQDLGDHTLLLWRGATSPQAQEDTGEPAIRGYLIGPQLPQTLTVTTAEGRRYEVQILAADDKACTLAYSPMSRGESIGGNASTSTGKGGAAVSPGVGASPGPLGRHALSFDGVDDKLIVPPSKSLTLNPPFFIEVWAKPDFSVLPEPRPGRIPNEEPWPEMSLMRQGWEPHLAGLPLREPGGNGGDGSDTDGWPSIRSGSAHGLNNVQSRGFMGFLVRRSGGLFAVREDGRVMQANIFRANEVSPGRPGWSHYYSFCVQDYLPEDYIPAATPLVIGERIVPKGFAFKGEIAEVRLWNKVLTPEEMQRYEMVSLTGNEPNLVACWDFERQAGGQMVYDITPNHNNARLGNSTYKEDTDPTWVDLSSVSADQGAEKVQDAKVIDGSSGSPEKTLTRLLEEAQPGGVVTVPKGRYTTPVEVTKPVVLRGESQEGCIIEVTADQPAVLVDTGGKGEVTIENLTVQWQLATDKPSAQPAALRVKDTNARIRNCRFLPLGDPQRSPTAVYIEGHSNSTVDNCRFSGFEYTVCYGPNTQGVVQDCIITDCGHQGVIAYDGATLTVERCLITGSKFHAVRCTGGTLDVKDSLLIKNANRGIYLGNKTGRGTITNNVILGNGSGISGFGRADYTITNNVVMDNQYAGIDMRDSCRFAIRNNVLAKNQRGLVLFKEGTANSNTVGKNVFWSNTTEVENLDKPADSITADPQFADPGRGDFTVRGSVRDEGQGLTNPQVIQQLWAKYEQLQRERPAQPATRAEPVAPAAQAPSQSSTALAWQRTDVYVPPDPNDFFPDDPEGGKKLNALFQAMDKDSRSDEEVLSTVRQGFRRTTQYRSLILRWIGNRYIWGKDPQNAQAIEIMYHAVPLERYYAVYFGLSVAKDKTPNILHTLADICLLGEGQEVGRITWGVGSQREQLLAYITPHLQDNDPARREIAQALVKHFRGELDFEQWQRDRHLEQTKAQFGSQLPQFKETLRTGTSAARYEVFTTILRNQMGALLDDSFLPAMEAAAADPDQRVRNEVARVAGGRWVWSAGKQDPNAIALMVKLSSDSDREVRYNAVYYGLSVVRDKSEPVIRRLVELALADHENNLYGRIVWGFRRVSEEASDSFIRILAEHLGRAKSDAHLAAAVYSLYREVLEKEPPDDWGLAQVRQQYPDDLFIVPFAAREPFQPENADALWNEFTRALPAGITAERPPIWWDSNARDIGEARIRGQAQAEAVRNAIANHPRLRAGEIRPLPVSMQLYLEEMHGVTPPGAQSAPPKPSTDARTSAASPALAPGPGPIQQKINAAAPGATIRLEPGVYKESLLINKPLTLEGAGWDKTVIIKERRTDLMSLDIQRLTAERMAAARTDAQGQEIAAQLKKELDEKLSPLVLTVENAQDVVIRGIKFTSPGWHRQGVLINAPLLKFDHSRVRLSDCAILGVQGDGVHILKGSGAQIEKTLVAGVWGTGIIVGPGPSASGVRIHDCDIRNCHYAGMGIRQDASNTVVERCRIWGAAWHGIRYDDASPQILGNLLFGHARFGIYASGRTAATVRGNLFYANEMTGMGCWFQSNDLIEGNTFVSNKETNLAILGASTPDIRKNIFYGSSVGVSLGNVGEDSPFGKFAGIVVLHDNLFWLTDHEMQWRRDASTTETLAVDADMGNVRVDPGFTAPAAKDFSLRPDSPARAKSIGAGDLLAFDSPWPLQPEELAIIPKGDTRDSRQWRQPN